MSSNGASNNSGCNRSGPSAPTRARKRIYDPENHPEEVVVTASSRRLGLYTGYHETVKG